MDLQQRLAQRREQQHTSTVHPVKQEAPAEVRHQGQHFDNNTIAQDRLYEEQFNGFKKANGHYPKDGELDAWVAEQQTTKEQVAPRVEDANFDKALSVNMDREQNGKKHIEVPQIMDALDRVSKQRQDEAKKIDMSPELRAQVPRLTK